MGWQADGTAFPFWDRDFHLAALALLNGCGLPAAGPQASDIVSQESPQGALGGYVLVDVDERVASITASQPRESFKRAFTTGSPPPDLRIGVGELGGGDNLGSGCGRLVFSSTR